MKRKPVFRTACVLFVVLLLLMACNRDDAAPGLSRGVNEMKSGPIVYVALGDSTGSGVGARNGGYVARLFRRFPEHRSGSELLNLCVSGATTDDVLRGQLQRGVQMKMRLAFGEGAAPLLAGNRLFLVFDHEAEAGSFIVALDKRNGKELWRAARDERSSWSTPLAIEHNGRMEIVVSATNKVRSYDPETGKVLWESGGLGANVIPVPVHQNDTVYVMSGYRDPKLMAIKLGKQGDLTGSDAIAWSHTRGLAYTASPVLYDNKLYVVTDNGLLTAFNATTGEPYYAQTRLPKAYNLKSSPVGANGKLYLAMEDGDVVVVKMGEKFEVLATNHLTDQIFIATPVIAGGELYLRGQKTLFCISEKK